MSQLLVAVIAKKWQKNEKRSIQIRKNLYLEYILLLIARLISPIDDINRTGYVGTTLDAFKYDPQDCEDQPSHKVRTFLLTGSNGKLRIHISKLFFQPKWFVLHLSSHAQVLKICKWIKVVVLKLGSTRLFLKTANQVDQLPNHFLSKRINEFMQKKIF